MRRLKTQIINIVQQDHRSANEKMLSTPHISLYLSIRIKMRNCIERKRISFKYALIILLDIFLYSKHHRFLPLLRTFLYYII